MEVIDLLRLESSVQFFLPVSVTGTNIWILRFVERIAGAMTDYDRWLG